MKRQYEFLPRRVTEEEMASAPMGWTGIMSDYSRRRREALRETKPGYNTLIAVLSAAIAKHDKNLIDVAAELTKGNVPKHIYLSLIGSVLCEFGLKDEGLTMLRGAVKLRHSCSLLLSIASETEDLDEKESLAKKVLDETPQDSDAIRHLAYVKYHKGKVEEAECLINEILLNEPDNVYAIEYKGNIYFDRKEYAKALEQYLKIKLKPMPISIQFRVCHCYYLLGAIGKAKKIAKRIHGKLSLVYEVRDYLEEASGLLTEILSS